jgi:FAD/FMN-containing dehydrogenase
MASVAGRRHHPAEIPDHARMARDLRRVIDGEVRFDPGVRAIYANDASIYRQVPIGVVIPRHAGDVIAALEVCRDRDLPVIARGCGTGLSGQSVNAAVMFDFSKYMRNITALDPGARTARVQPGVICDELRAAAAPHGLTWAVDPAGVDELPAGGAWLLAEYGGDSQEEANYRAEAAARTIGGGEPKLFEDPRREAEIWEIRRSGCEYTRMPGEHSGLAGWEDAAVPPERLGDYLREWCKLLDRHGYTSVLFGHFGQGCVHTRQNLDLETAAGIENFRRFIDEAGDLAVAFGGSLSGEHGDGQLRANQLVKMFGPELVSAFTEFKRIWDPPGKMNPGKVVAAYAPDQNLAAVRLRDAADGPPVAAPDPRRPARAGRGRDAGDRARAELPGRVPRRAGQPVPRRPGRAAAQPAELYARRVPGRARLPAGGAERAGAGPGPLPPRRRAHL